MPLTLMNSVSIKSLTNNSKKRVDRGSNTPMVKCHPFGTLVTAKIQTPVLVISQKADIGFETALCFKSRIYQYM